MTGTYLQAVKYLTEQNSLHPDKKWDVNEHKERRSLSQNAYYWQLITEVSRRKHQSVAYTHNTELRALRLAVWYEGQYVRVLLPDTDETEARVMEQTEYHLAVTNQRKGEKRVYVLLRNSSDFTTKEFSDLLDLLIQDAQALGIETMTPAELAIIRGREYARENKAKPNTSQG